MSYIVTWCTMDMLIRFQRCDSPVGANILFGRLVCNTALRAVRIWERTDDETKLVAARFPFKEAQQAKDQAVGKA